MVENRRVECSVKRDMWPFPYLAQTWFSLFSESKIRYDFGDSGSECFDIQMCQGWNNMKAAGLVFVAFWIESYVNYALSEVCADEYEILERARPLEKISLVCKKLNISFGDINFKELFRFRDKLAHGKQYSPSEYLYEMSLDEYHASGHNMASNQYVEADWEKYLNEINTDEFTSRVQKFLDEVREKGKLEFYANGAGDMTIFSATVK